MPSRAIKVAISAFACFCSIASASDDEPLQLLSRPDKTELADQFGVVSATGGEFGIPWMWWWHRINAGWGSVRPRVAQLVVFDETTGAAFTLQGGERRWAPNHLHQRTEINGIVAEEDKFVDQDSLVDLLRFENRTNTTRRLRLYFNGKPEGRATISFDRTRSALLISELKDYGKRYLPGTMTVNEWIGSSRPIDGWAVGSFAGDIDKFFGRDLGFGAFINDANLRKYVESYEGTGWNYAFQINLQVAPQTSEAVTLAATMGTNRLASGERNNRIIQTARTLLNTNDEQVRRYFTDYVPFLRSPDEKLNRLWYHLWYVLQSNRVRKGETVRADFNVPTKFGYWGCYVWDTAFHVIGQMFLRDPRVGEDSVHALLSLQFPNGYLPINSGADDVEVNTPEGTYNLDPADFYSYQEDANPFLARLEFRHPNPHQWGVPQVRGEVTVNEKTQLPIIGMAVWESYLVSGNREFLAEVFPALSKYDDWMWRRRNTGDGLLVWYHPDESGWDDATRMLPLPVKTVDGSVAAYMLHRMLADTARVLGSEQDEHKYAERAAQTARSINQKMWRDDTRFYYDLSLDDIKRPQKSLAGFTPLLAGIVESARIDALAAHLRNPREFWTTYPVPSLSKDDPSFNAQRWGWNGPAWIPTNWFVMEGFARAGRVDLSNAVLAKTVEMMSKPSGYPTASEQYNSETGVPFGVADYSWCAVVNHYITKWVGGIQPDASNQRVTIAPHLLDNWKWFELRNIRVGDHSVGYRYDSTGKMARITLQHTGPQALTVELVLPAKGEVKGVRIGASELRPDSFHVENGVIRIGTKVLNQEQVVEVALR